MRRRIGVLALCRDRHGRVLLVPDGSHLAGWSLPGGLVGHGEHPEASMRRHLPADGAVIAAVGGPVTVVTDIDHMAHDDWIVLDVTLDAPHDVAVDGASNGQVSSLRWASLAELDALPLADVTARALGIEPSPRSTVGSALVEPSLVGSALVQPPLVEPESPLIEPEPRPSERTSPFNELEPPLAGTTWRRQRFAVYALATDPAGRVLLTRISDGYPGAGRWHLPGGGTDAGESATAGLLRELIEETDQRGRLDEPLSLSHRHQRDAMGPEGVPIDWQGIRVVYRVHIDVPTQARVTEGAGSTVEAGWFTAAEALRLALTEVARDSIERHLR